MIHETNYSLESFFEGKEYDIRKSNNGRWIDQKCTHDVVSFVADCICYYLENGGEEPLQSTTIWRSDYAVQYVQDYFGKPYPLDEEPHDEFNKFYRQPMKMLAAAGVLEEAGKVGSTIQYRVADRETLDYISTRGWNAEKFLELYIEKTLKDSGLWPPFESFFESETPEAYKKAKSAFEQFCYSHTPIRNKAETGRIFAKVINPLALKRRTRGSINGSLSHSTITVSDLVYNRPNFRDRASKKDKSVARRSHPDIIGNAQTTKQHLITKQMKALKQFNREYRGSKSEVIDDLGLGEPASQAHHIFPKSAFPEIADYPENLIMLTSAQHFERAHPNGNTQSIDPGYQYYCLSCKVKSIAENIGNDLGIPEIYDLDRLRDVLTTGLSTDCFELIDFEDYNTIIEGIRAQYSPAVTSRYAHIVL